MFKITCFLSLILLFKPCFGQQEIPLYPGKIPNSIALLNEETKIYNAEVDTLVNNVTIPTLTVFLPSKGKSTGRAVIICPGGGYHTLLTKREGSDVARALNKAGIAAFVLKYRLPNDKTMVDKSIGPLQDAQQAIKLLRENATKWGVSPNQIGIMGFSAGGHLASTAGTHFDKALIENKNNTSLRPDFMALIFPVISLTDEIGHIGSRTNLIGTNATLGFQDRIANFSNELQVSTSTPPTFLTHANDDSVVPVANTMVFYEALLKHKVPADLSIYSRGEHGYLKYPSFDTWFSVCLSWIQSLKL